MTIYSSLLKLISHDVRAVIWFEQSALNKDLVLFETLDYVLGNMMTHHLDHHPLTRNMTFVTTTFEKPFYVFFQTADQKDLSLSFLNQAEREKVIVINPELADQNLIKKIENDFRWVDFLKADKILKLH